MEVRFIPDQNSFKRFTTDELRNNLLLDDLFLLSKIQMVYTELDRAIVGSCVPVEKELILESSKKEMGAEHFTERREIGIINIGSSGFVNVDNEVFEISPRDGLYIGKGQHKIFFGSVNKNEPAFFYFVSYPAHKTYPTLRIKNSEALATRLGSKNDCNERTIHKYIHPDGVKSCQLVMGLTELEKGSVWNTMPSHTHQRRTEVYMYFDLDPESFVVHLLGEPDETRHIIMRNKEVVLNPSWSIHSGVGNSNYTFIWAMGGENQIFDDMDWVPGKSMK